MGGIDLCRRKDQRQVYGMTFTLLTNSEGKKMGKTANGAVWLDPKKTSAYDFYQYWRNVQDEDVIKCLKLLTFVPMEEIREYEKMEGAQLNQVKMRLAYEVTKLVHGEEEAQNAQSAASAAFGGSGDSENMPTTSYTAETFGDEKNILELLLETALIPSKAEGRRLITQGGVSVNGEKVTDPNAVVKAEDFQDGKLIIKKGKKVYHRVVINEK